MAEKIADRLLWAVETLAAELDDRVLEIGCGHGIAVSLICDRLIGGKITAIDRSKTMIDTARSKNLKCVESGKAEFQVAALDKADFGGETFSKIFAVNVNVFWMQPAKELEVIKRILTAEGALYLFFQPPSASKTREIGDKLTHNLQAHGFTVKDLLFKDLQPVPAVCAIAQT